MKLISWNINSLRLRLPLLKKLIEQSAADVICLQETKVQDADFPLLDIKSLGYNFVEFSGEKSYNGVAIISKIPLKNFEAIDILGYNHKRHIKATIETKFGEVDLHNFYVPAGGDIPDVSLNNKFDHKLKFIDWMTEYFAAQKDKKIIIVGDMNIAPLENDVWSHKQLLKIVSHTPIEVEKINHLQKSLNFIDTHRHFVDSSKKLYSWWSYRAKDPLGADKGRRLDHIWATPNLKNHIQDIKIYKDFRLLNQPSDHVPIQTNFNFTMKKIVINSKEEMINFAREISVSAKVGDVIGLKGTLGAGKSFFARSFINALSEKPVEVLSPTFNLVYSYDTKKGEVFHFDLYRLKSAEELENIGFFEAPQNGICLIEWPEIAAKFLPKNYTEIEIKIISEDRREVVWTK